MGRLICCGEGEVVMSNTRHMFVVGLGYFNDSLTSVKPVLATVMSVITYVLFPDKAFIPAAIALVGAMVLDIITKYYALSYQNEGLRNAVATRAISSRALWDGTKRKLVETLVVMILAGLSVRVTMLTSVAVFLATVAYSIMFLKECQSIIENMIDAGHEDLKWLLFWLQKKQDKVLDDTTISAQNTVEAKVQEQMETQKVDQNITPAATTTETAKPVETKPTASASKNYV